MKIATSYLKHLGGWVLVLVLAPLLLAALAFPLLGPFSILLSWAYFCIPPFFVLRVLLSMSVLQNEFLLPDGGFELLLVIAVWICVCALLAVLSSVLPGHFDLKPKGSTS